MMQMVHTRTPAPTGLLRAVLTASLLLVAGRACAQPAAGPLSASPRPARYPVLNKRLDWSLTAAGTGLVLVGLLATRAADPVPPEGLDPGGIAWRIDRDAVGNGDDSADRLSDSMRTAAVAVPLVLAAITDSRGLKAVGDRALVYVEAGLLAQGTVRLGKTGFGRARPFTYVADADRPTGSRYDVTQDRAFRSLPSGHAATAWTAVGVGVTEHLLNRPQASTAERLAVSTLGGALAGATSALRVKAGQHFPTDVVLGGAWGLAIGVTVPWLHRGEAPGPSRRALWETALGLAAGATVGALTAR